VKRAPLTLSLLLLTAVPAQAAGPRILATGDSMMRGVHSHLGAELMSVQEVSFRAELRIGEGITNEPWVHVARRQVQRHRQRATVAFMGANDGYDMIDAPCCGKRWVAKYRDRIKRTIRVWSRNGRAEVYWLTLPAAGFGRRIRLFPKINRILSRAVTTSGPHAHLVDTWAALSPDGRFHRTMLVNGVEVEIRSPDGVHLRPGGQAIATRLVRDAMLRDGVISWR
jgi:hypothetical protein